MYLCLYNIYKQQATNKLQTTFLKATQLLQCDAMPWQSEAITK